MAIVEIMGMPASGKTAIHKLLQEEAGPFPEKYQKWAQKKMKNPNLQGEWEEQYPGTWEMYLDALSRFTIDYAPEPPEVWRRKAFEKHCEAMSLHLALQDFEGTFLWNKGVTQSPLELFMTTNHEFDQTKAENIILGWPVSDIVIEIVVEKERVRQRYRDRRNYRMARPGKKGARSRLYRGWTDEQYRERYDVWMRMIGMYKGWSRMKEWWTLPNNFDSFEDLKDSKSFKRIVERLKELK